VLSEFARECAEAGEGPGAIVARTEDDVRKVLVEGPAGIIAMSPPWFRPIYEPSKKKLTWPNGVEALTFSAQEPNSLRGPQHAWAIADELAAWEYLEEAWGNLTFGLRLGLRPRVAIATTPRPLKPLREMLADKATHVTRGRTRDNQDNLSPDALADMEKKYAGTRMGRQELDGEILDDVPGALWTRIMLQAALERGSPYSGLRERVRDMFDRICIGVDPSGSPGAERGDAIGIVVAGKLRGIDAAVVLEDATCQERPEVWAAKVAELFTRWAADLVVAEGNFGGDMVRALLQSADTGRGLPVKIVHASRGKHIRAEPISRLYEQGRVHHARGFAQLEDELCFFTPNGFMDDVSPNRADAMVWALTELMLGVATPRISRL
jgi:phage terminase large subunit-like protein